MLLKSFLISLILPPCIFVAAIAAGLLLSRRTPRFGSILAWFGLLLLTMSTLPIVSDMMLRVLERDLPVAPPSAKPPAAIVLLGADISGAGYDMAGAHLGFLSL